MAPNPPSLPRPGWYPDPLDADQVRWWDGVRWTPAATPKPRKLGGRVRTVLVVGTSLLGVNALISVPIFLLLALFAGSGSAFVAACAEGGAFLVAIPATSIRGGLRSRMTALGAAVAVAVGVWVFMLVWFPNRPEPRLSQLRKDPAAKLIYPGARVALTSAHDSRRELGGELIGSSIDRVEATDATPDQALAWFDPQLTSTGWTRTTTPPRSKTTSGRYSARGGASARTGQSCSTSRSTRPPTCPTRCTSTRRCAAYRRLVHRAAGRSRPKSG